MRSVPALALLAALAAASTLVFAGDPVPAVDVTGTWSGALKVSGMELRLVVHLSRGDDGALTATLDSPDQNATGIPVQTATFTDGKLHLDCTAVRGTYDGTLSAGADTLRGQWQQSGMTLPLDLVRGEIAATLRPQEPQPPFPYTAEDVTFANPDAPGVTLAGTLTLPPLPRPAPCVVLITGSGPQDRDEALMGHKPFLVLADHLARHGIAALRYDDRGVGKSTGSFATATSRDFATDARAAVAYLLTRSDIDAHAIGLVGHSEGGIIAPMVAAEDSAIAFIVLLAGTGETGEDILYAQSALIARAEGAPEDEIALQTAEQKALFEVVRTVTDSAQAAAKLHAIIADGFAKMTPEERKEAGGDVDAVASAEIKQLLSPWLRTFLTYDPRPTLEKVHCPVLAIAGSKDLQVPAKENLAAIAQALAAGGNTRVTTCELPGLNHLFQTAETGSPMEYAKIEQTMAPAALDTVTHWIKRVVATTP